MTLALLLLLQAPPQQSIPTAQRALQAEQEE